MSRSLVIAGHGSHLNEDSGRPVRMHAATLAATGAFDAVHVAFWKEEPSFARVLDACGSDVTVVPAFMARGYFTRQIIPREMRLTGRLSCVDGRIVRYTEPVGAKESLANVVLERAREADMSDSDAVIVLGHGTDRDAESSKTAEDHSLRLADLMPNREVLAAFIDQEPGVAEVIRRVSATSVVIVPLFMSDGWHVGHTIPADLEGFEAGGRTIRMTGAVGTHPSLATVMLDLAKEAASW